MKDHQYGRHTQTEHKLQSDQGPWPGLLEAEGEVLCPEGGVAAAEGDILGNHEHDEDAVDVVVVSPLDIEEA